MPLSFPPSPTNGHIYTDPSGVKWIYNATKQRWARYAQHITATFVQPTAPTATAAGQFWYDTANELLKVWSGSFWETASGPAVKVSLTEPSGVEGDLWFDTTDNILYVYTTEWTIAGGQTGHVVADAPPATANEGDQWEDTTDGTISYWDATNETWVQASHPERGFGEILPQPQQLIIYRADSSVDVYDDIVDISPYLKGNGADIPSLQDGDTVYFGTGNYTWEGHYLSTLGERINRDWYLPNVSLICPVKHGATIKLVQGKTTYVVDGGIPKRAMSGSVWVAETIPFFVQGSTVVGNGTLLKGIVFDCNAQDNIENHAGLENICGTGSWTYDPVTKRPIGYRCEYMFTAAFGSEAGSPRFGIPRKWKMEDCKVIGWTMGGFFVPNRPYSGDGVDPLESYKPISPPNRTHQEQFVFILQDAEVRGTEFSSPFDLSNGSLDPNPTLARESSPYYSYYGQTFPRTGIYCSVLQIYNNCLIDNCAVIGPEYIYGEEDTKWWRTVNQPWIVDGLRGYRENGLFAYCLPVASNDFEDWAPVIIRNSLAERVAHAFHRDTLNMSEVVIENCVSYGCVKGLRNIVPTGVSSTTLTVRNCEFHIIDIFTGNHDTRNVDFSGTGYGYECGIYLDARSSTYVGTTYTQPAKIYNVNVTGCYFTTYKEAKASEQTATSVAGQAVLLMTYNNASGGPSVGQEARMGRIYGLDFRYNKVAAGSGLSGYRYVREEGTIPRNLQQFDPTNFQRGTDSDYLDYIDVVLMNGGIVNINQEKFVETFFVNEKAAGTWGTSIKRLYYLGWQNLIACMVDMVTRKVGGTSSGPTPEGLTASSGFVQNTGGNYLVPDTDGALGTIGATGDDASLFAVITDITDIFGRIPLGSRVTGQNARIAFSGASTTSLNFQCPESVAGSFPSSSSTDNRGVFVGSSTATNNRFLVHLRGSGSPTVYTNTTTHTSAIPTIRPFIFASSMTSPAVSAASFIGSMGVAGYGRKMDEATATGFAQRLKTFWESTSGLNLPS